MRERPETVLDDLLALAAEREASDLHLKAGRPPLLRIAGQIVETDRPALSAEAVRGLLEAVMDDRHRALLQERGDAEFARALPSGDRFRVSVYRQRGLWSAAIRRVSRRIPSFDDLHLPRATMERLCEATEGLVVFAGVAGTGKSTSIAACLDYISARRPCHILTVEDPIEYLIEDRLAFVDQREIGTDVPTYEAALASMLREDPDVVFVSEVRWRAVAEAVLRAAETMRLALTTVHAGSAAGAVVRVLDLFEERERALAREMLASHLVAVVCQRLVEAADPNVARVPATEVMWGTPAVRAAIRAGEFDRLADLIAAGTEEGMHDMTQDLARLVREEWVLPKVAYQVAPNPDALKMAIRGIRPSQGTVR